MQKISDLPAINLSEEDAVAGKIKQKINANEIYLIIECIIF
jgi:hypothetical protein